MDIENGKADFSDGRFSGPKYRGGRYGDRNERVKRKSSIRCFA